jgi:hypothetical protein
VKHRFGMATLSVAGIAASLLVATPAEAAPVDECNLGGGDGLCTFWGQSYNGAQAEVLYGRADLAASPVVYYPANGTGQGEHIYNNNGSEQNGNGSCTITIYYNQNYSGYSLTLQPYLKPGWEKAGSGLGNLLNNLRSFRINC